MPGGEALRSGTGPLLAPSLRTHVADWTAELQLGIAVVASSSLPMELWAVRPAVATPCHCPLPSPQPPRARQVPLRHLANG